MAIDWNAFFANGGFSNANSDPQSYDGDDLDDGDFEEYYDDYGE